MAFHPDNVKVGGKCSKPGAPAGVFLDLTEAGLLLVIRNNDTNESLVRDLNARLTQFRYVVHEEILVFMARFGMTPWYIAPFHMGRASCQEINPEWRSKGLPVYVLVVEASSGTLKAKHDFLLRIRFSRKILEEMERLSKAIPLNWDIYLRNFYRKFPKVSLPAQAGLLGNINQ